MTIEAPIEAIPEAIEAFGIISSIDHTTGIGTIEITISDGISHLADRMKAINNLLRRISAAQLDISKDTIMISEIGRII